jgi:WhiB family redox-sensing transcriptional regulator
MTTALPPMDPVTGRTWPQASRKVREAMAKHGRAWHADGACTPQTAHLFYAPTPTADVNGRRVTEGHRLRAARIAAAKRICASCPVLARCRAYALDAGEQYGIWGGLTEGERDAVRKVYQHRVRAASSRRGGSGGPKVHRRPS